MTDRQTADGQTEELQCQYPALNSCANETRPLTNTLDNRPTYEIHVHSYDINLYNAPTLFVFRKKCNSTWIYDYHSFYICKCKLRFRRNEENVIIVDYGIGQIIIFSSCGFFLSSIYLVSFFLAWSQRPHIGCLPYFDTWCGPSANLECRCRCETCCVRLAENAGPKKSTKIGYGHHRTTLSGYISATKAHIDNRKKIFKQQYLLHMSSQYGELRPTNGWDRLAGLGHPIIFQRGIASWQRYYTAL